MCWLDRLVAGTCALVGTALPLQATLPTAAPALCCTPLPSPAVPCRHLRAGGHRAGAASQAVRAGRAGAGASGRGADCGARREPVERAAAGLRLHLHTGRRGREEGPVQLVGCCGCGGCGHVARLHRPLAPTHMQGEGDAQKGFFLKGATGQRRWRGFGAALAVFCCLAQHTAGPLVVLRCRDASRWEGACTHPHTHSRMHVLALAHTPAGLRRASAC